MLTPRPKRLRPLRGDGIRSCLNVAHLIHGERTDWIARARIILTQGADRKFTPFDMTAHIRDSEGKTLTDLLDEFGRLRAQNLVTLAGFELTDAQLARVMAKQCREAIGPWRAYLPIMDR